MTSVEVQKVSLSDFGRALDAIENELYRLASQKREIARKMAALHTQAMVITQVARRMV